MNFRQRTQRAGQILRHTPLNARQTAAFWIEHVLQFGGEHLKPTSTQLTWWQLYCLDILGFLLIGTILLLFTLAYVTKFIFKALMKLLKPTDHAKRD